MPLQNVSLQFCCRLPSSTGRLQLSNPWVHFLRPRSLCMAPLPSSMSAAPHCLFSLENLLSISGTQAQCKASCHFLVMWKMAFSVLSLHFHSVFCQAGTPPKRAQHSDILWVAVKQDTSYLFDKYFTVHIDFFLYCNVLQNCFLTLTLLEFEVLPCTYCYYKQFYAKNIVLQNLLTWNVKIQIFYSCLFSSLLSMIVTLRSNQRYLFFLTLLLRQNIFYQLACETGRL